MNKEMDRRCLRQLYQLMEWEFVLLELVLYLDTHPDDRKAYEDYCETAEKVHQMRMEYEKNCAMLSVEGQHCPEQYPWQWIEQPWPWEIEY